MRRSVILFGLSALMTTPTVAQNVACQIEPGDTVRYVESSS